MGRRIAFLLLAWPAVGWAQGPAGTGLGDAVGPERSALDAVDAAAAPSLLETPGGAFAASLVLPGAGQAALGLRRWAVYGLLEVGFWALHLEAAADARSLSRAYRDLAWDVARLPTGPASRQDGPWDYYEDMSHYLASGAYDRDARTGGVQPETDPGTFNGSVWELARGLFLPSGAMDPSSPEYQAALAYYTERAAGPDFLWTWVGEPEALTRFRGLIGEADDEARLRSTALGLVLANHVVSAVDALVVARLRGEQEVHLESRVVPTPGALRWNVGLRITLPD